MVTSPVASRKRHHGRTRNCTAWPHRALAESLPHAAAALPHRFDRKATLGIEGSRKLGEEKALELLDCHRHWHPSPSTTATELDDCRQVKKVRGRCTPQTRVQIRHALPNCLRSSSFARINVFCGKQAGSCRHD